MMKPEHKKYLDDLRDSGVTNMFAAPSYVEEEFGIPRWEAREIVKEWMDSYEKEQWNQHFGSYLYSVSCSA